MKNTEYHIFEGNGGDYHLAIVEDGKCIFWFMDNGGKPDGLQTVIEVRDYLIAGTYCIDDYLDSNNHGVVEGPQEAWDQMQHFLETTTECRELDDDDIAELLADSN